MTRIGSVVRGAAALVVLVALLVGMPALLVLARGSPLPDLAELGDVTTALTKPDHDGSLFLALASTIAWLAWASFTFSVVIEAVAAAFHLRAPRLQALRYQQRAAAALVGVILVAFASTNHGSVASASTVESAVNVERVGATDATHPIYGAGDVPLAHEHADLRDDSSPYPVRTSFGLGALLAAGVLAVLWRRRQAQSSRRRPGQTLPPDSADIERFEQSIRDVADPSGRAAVDAALRQLVSQLAGGGRSAPEVGAARLTADRFELYLSVPSSAPQPWTEAAEGAVWTVQLSDIEGSETLNSIADVGAPYPALVTVGHDLRGAHVMLDLEQVGWVSIEGPSPSGHAAVAALVLELATTPWADDLTVTVVGGDIEVVALMDTGRVRWLPDVEALLTILEDRQRIDRQALEALGVPTAAQARRQAGAVEEWMPEIALVTSPLTVRQSSRLADVIRSEPRVGVAVVTMGAADDAGWKLRIHDGDPERGTLEPVGMTLRPQYLDETRMGAIADMLRATLLDPVGEPEPEPTVDELVAVARATRDRQHVAGSSTPQASIAPGLQSDVSLAADGPVRPVPYIRLLGSVEVEHARGPVQPSHRGTLTEIAAFIATHPGVRGDAIEQAIWPGEPQRRQARDQAVSRLRRWFGHAPGGQRFLPKSEDGTFQFEGVVRTDWQQLLELLEGDCRAAPTECLDSALALVRGMPFSTDPGRRPKYRWAEKLRRTMVEQIVDTAAQRASRALQDGDHEAAVAAASTGLELEPGVGTLWRHMIRAQFLANDRAGVEATTERMYATLDGLSISPEPDTTGLIIELQATPSALESTMLASERRGPRLYGEKR